MFLQQTHLWCGPHQITRANLPSQRRTEIVYNIRSSQKYPKPNINYFLTYQRTRSIRQVFETENDFQNAVWSLFTVVVQSLDLEYSRYPDSVFSLLSLRKLAYITEVLSPDVLTNPTRRYLRNHEYNIKVITFHYIEFFRQLSEL